MTTQGNWKKLAEEKRKKRDDLLPTEWILSKPPPTTLLDVTHIPEQSGILNKKEIEITNAVVEILLEKMANKTWSAVDVITAFSKRAIIAQQLTNCLTEIFIERASKRAAWLDEQLAKTGKTVGPLHGLPISLKDQINVTGIESTMGYTTWIGDFAEQDSVLASILESQGAILYVKTNVPQTLMWPETYNHIFGRTANPFNRSLTCGGSSGGEGALVAMRGSPLGVGTDIGGSVRIPSAFNGLYGFRPSYNRMPYSGCVNSLDGQEAMLSVLGPITKSIEGIKRFMKVVLNAQPWNRDPMVLRMPWNERAYELADHGNGGQLCYGILWNDGVVHPHPPVTRALEIVKAALLAKGHRVIDWKPHKQPEIANAATRLYNADGGEDFLACTAPTGEPIIKTMVPQPGEDPTWPKPSHMGEMPHWSSGGHGGKKGLTAYELWQVHKQRRELRTKYLEYWQASASETGTGRPVDAVVAPVAPYPAPPHGTDKYTQYTVIWNLLDYPAIVIPITNVDPQKDVKRTRNDFFGEYDRRVFEFYEPGLFENAPVSVQVVGRTQEEEAVIRLGEIVASGVRESGV